MIFPGDAYNKFITRVREDTAHKGYSNPNDAIIENYGVGLVISFRGKDKNGYLKVY